MGYKLVNIIKGNTMALSILVAKIISLIYLALGLGVLAKTVNFKTLVDEIQTSKTILFLSGSLGIAIGVILLENHNIWVANWTVIITLISWGMLLGGVVLVMIPNLFISIIKFSEGFLKNTLIMGVFMVSFGLFMGYFGFIH